MRYKGQLFVDDQTALSGLPVELVLMDSQLAVSSGDETIGRYPLSETTVERIGGERFQLDIGSESLIFVADDALGFSYEALPFIRSGGSHPTSVGIRRLVQKVFRGNDARRVPERRSTAPAADEIPDGDRSLVDEEFLDLLEAPPPVQTADVEPDHESTVDGVDPEATTISDPVSSPPPEPPSKPRCEGALSDGSQCPMEPLGGSRLCYTHTGRLDGQRAALEERTERAVAAATRIGLPDLDDVLGRLEKAVAQVHDGSLSPQQAMAMASLVQAMVETIELSGTHQD